MAFLNKLRSLPLPPVKNVLNVAMQTARQTMPGKHQQKDEYEQPPGGVGGGSMDQAGGPGRPPIPPRPQSVRFADQEGIAINFFLLVVISMLINIFLKVIKRMKFTN